MQIELLISAQANPDLHDIVYYLPAGHSVRLLDVLDSAFHFEGSGALRLNVLSGQLLATSRTYNSDPSGTFGQFIAASSADEAFTAGDEAACTAGKSIAMRMPIIAITTSSSTSVKPYLV